MECTRTTEGSYWGMGMGKPVWPVGNVLLVFTERLLVLLRIRLSSLFKPCALWTLSRGKVLFRALRYHFQLN